MSILNVKTSSYFEENKVKSLIKSYEDDIREIKLQLGDTAYRGWKSGSDVGAEIDGLLRQIDEKVVAISEQQLRLTRIEQEKQAIIRNNSNAQPVETRTEAAEGAVSCPSCGRVFPKGVNFCRACGTRLV